MLAFRVIQIEQHRALQQNAIRPLPPNASLLTEPSFGRNFATPNRQIYLLFGQDVAAICSVNSGHWTQKNERIFAKWAPTSNRQRIKNRCFRKRTTKPRLTGARTHIRLLPNFAKTAQGSDELHY